MVIPSYFVVIYFVGRKFYKKIEGMFAYVIEKILKGFILDEINLFKSPCIILTLKIFNIIKRNKTDFTRFKFS